MGSFHKLARDTVLMTCASLLMRCIGLTYQVWLVGRIGAAGVGLWQLVSAVCGLSATLAISGIRFTATRLIAEELGSGTKSAAPAVRRCMVYAAVFGFAAFLILFLGAEPIGFLWVGDARTVLSLRTISFTMPMIALSSVLNGYFIASGKAWKSAIVQVLEQITGVICVIVLLKNAPQGDLELSCLAISRGNLAADAVSLLLISVLYTIERKSFSARSDAKHLTIRMLHIAVPLAMSAYARAGLTTMENLLIPRKLRDAGYSANNALSGYGTITGMVFPIIGFPSCLLSAAAELSIPELTAAQVQGDGTRIRQLTGHLLKLTVLFSLSVATFLFIFADHLGLLIYGSNSVGHYIRILAFLVPIMYMDIITDGCLKGLGQMMWSMRYNVTEALLGVLLVIIVLPKKALSGYIFVLYFCEIFNFTLSILRLRKVSKELNNNKRKSNYAAKNEKNKLFLS